MNKFESVEANSQAFAISQSIAQFSTAPVSGEASRRARHVLRLSLLDWISVAVAGCNEPVSGIVRKLVSDEAGTAEATVIGHDAGLPARAAALSNGACSHALDYDDTHFIYLGHPSVAVLPAALAVAEKSGSRGSDFLDAALIGVETACRIGDWMGREHYQRGFHQTATSGSFGATVAAARLLGLDEERTRHALGLVSTKASGLKSQFGTMGKPYHAGMAAANGVEAALLAAAGIISRADGMECPQGFADTHASERNNHALMLGDLEREFVFESVSHKFHACCHGTHAALEALIEAQDYDALDPDEIEIVEITVHPRYLTVCNIAEPKTGLEAKFSYRLTAAMILCSKDTSSLATFTDEICREPELIALRDRISVIAEPEMPDTGAAIRVVCKSGRQIEGRYDIGKTLPTDVREAKIRTKAASLLGKCRAANCWDAIQALDHRDTTTDLRVLAQL